MSTLTTQEPKTCVYCGTKEQETKFSTALRNRGGYSRTNFGNCSAKGLDCCNKCWSLKYPSSRIPSTSISASGITHEHSLMKCGHSFVDSKPLKFKFPKLAELLPTFQPLARNEPMTVSELDLGSMNAAEAVETLHDNADKLNGEQSKDETELLVEKMAQAAHSDGNNVSLLDISRDSRFSEEERLLFTVAIQERAERRFAEIVQAALDKRMAKYKDDPVPLLPKREDGYWIDSSNVTPDVPEQGPYENKREAEEARSKLVKLYKQEQKKAETNGNRKSLKEKAAEIHNQPVDPSEESENTVANKVSKPAKKAAPKKAAAVKKPAAPKAANPKAAAKAKKPASDKKPKAAKAKKPAAGPKKDKPLSCIEAAVVVLKAATAPMTVPEIYEVMLAKKLWSAGGGSRGEGKTPIPTINAKLCLEMQNKGKESRVKRVGVGKYSAA